jgi:thioesterase domain-containing protein/acyl carrier protein
MDELQSFLKEKLPEYMVPSAFVILDDLPLTPNGKLDRKALPNPDAIRSRPHLEETDSYSLSRGQDVQHAYVAPRDELEQTLVDIWQEVLGIKRVGIYDNFFELGGNSLLAVRLFVQIEKRLGKNLPPATLFEAPNIELLANILRRTESPETWPSLVALQPNGSKQPFFCIPGHDGDATCFTNLIRYLDSDQPFYGLQAQGLDGKQDPYTRLEDIATHYIKEIRTLQPDGPYLLGGWCFGGIVAFEMAQQLQAQDQQVVMLVLLDSFCPPISRLHRFVSHLRNLWHLRLIHELSYVLDKARSIYRLFLGAIRSQTRSPRDIYKGRVSKVNLRAMRRYVPQAYPGGITLFLASEPHLEPYEDERLGWRELAAGGIEVQELPVKQSDMLREPHVRLLVEKLRAYIEKAQTIN